MACSTSPKKKAKSDVWQYFTVSTANPTKAICYFCKCSISRGGKDSRTFTTSNLHKHLNTYHQRDMYKTVSRPTQQKVLDFSQKTNETDDDDILDLGLGLSSSRPSDGEHKNGGPVCKSSDSSRPNSSVSSSSSCPDSRPISPSSTSLSSTVASDPASDRSTTRPRLDLSVDGRRKTTKLSFNQPTLVSLIEKKKMMLPTDKRAETITSMIAEMICVDCQPFSIVEDTGFKRLINFLEPRYTVVSRKTLSSVIIPSMYEKVVVKVKQMLSNAEYISITTDMWTSSSNADYLSITAHFISDEFDYQHISLDVIPFTYETHSALHIAEFITATLEDWGILHKLYLIVRDNGRNFEAAMDKGEFKNNCFHYFCYA